MDPKELERLEKLAQQLQDRIDNIHANWNGLKLHQRLAKYDLQEQLHAIYTKLIHPENVVLHKVAVDTFHLGRATDRKLITESLKKRGYLFVVDFEKQEIRFWRQVSPTVERPPREFDVVEVMGDSSPTVQPTETKTSNLIQNSVDGGIKTGPIEAEFKQRSGSRKALGGQLATEDWIKDLATDAHVEHVGMSGTNIVTGKTHHVKVTPDKLKKSLVSVYQTPGKYMFKPGRPPVPPVGAVKVNATSPKAASPRGKQNKGTASKGTTSPPVEGGKPDPWQRGARQDSATKQAKLAEASRDGKSQAGSKLNEPVPIGADSGKPTPSTKVHVGETSVVRPVESGRTAASAREAVGNRLVEDVVQPPHIEAPHVELPRGESHLLANLPHGLPKTSAIKGAKVVGKLLAVGRAGFRATRWLAGVAFAMYLMPPLKLWEWALEMGFRVLDDLLAYRHAKQRSDRRKDQALRSVFENQGNALGTLIVAHVTTDQQYDKLLDAWNTNPRIVGFVYSRISAVIEEEVFRGGAKNVEIEKVTRYRPLKVEVQPTSSYHDFTVEAIGEAVEVAFKKADDKYIDDAIRKNDLEDGVLYARRDVKYLRRYRLKYTIQTPAITPFDIVIIKTNNLFMDLLAFTSSFAAARPVLELVSANFQETYQERIGIDLEFPAPLKASACDYCLSYLNWTARQLSEHQIREVDIHGGLEAPRIGWERRRDILWRLLMGRGSTKYGKNFEFFVDQMSRIVDRTKLDAEARAIATELEACAWILLADLRRLERSQMIMPEYYYFGPSYRYHVKK